MRVITALRTVTTRFEWVERIFILLESINGEVGWLGVR